MDSEDVTGGAGVQSDDAADRSGDVQTLAVGNGESRQGVRLVLAGQHPLTLCGLSQVFESAHDCTVVAVCTSAPAVVDTVQRHEPDMLILDLSRHDTFRVLRHLQRERRSTCVVVLASAADEDEMAHAVELGARAVVRKELSPDAFLACIREVDNAEHRLHTAGDTHLAGKAVRAGVLAMRRPAARQLTPREAEIAQLAVRGISTKDIAAQLDVKQGTVKIHLHSIYEKLNVDGRLGLVLYARRHRLV
jgi:DNA-binding NarL/FixJ family response regulator